MKGIILAGGTGSRLFPATMVVCKQLLPVYDKPMIYYPLSTLMLAGITEILIISTKQDIPIFEKLFKDGNDFGLDIKYAIQSEPKGLAEAFIIGADFIGNDTVCLILGDNLFYGHDLVPLLVEGSMLEEGAIVFGYYVNNPKEYGVVEFDKDYNALSLEEKPNIPKSNWAVVGLYFYDNEVVEISKKIIPSKRGELEITDINNEYLKKKKLKVKVLGRGFAWLDTGTHSSLVDASNFVKVVEDRQGLKIACIEEIALSKKYISREKFKEHIVRNKNSSYGKYLELIDKRIK